MRVHSKARTQIAVGIADWMRSQCWMSLPPPVRQRLRSDDLRSWTAAHTHTRHCVRAAVGVPTKVRCGPSIHDSSQRGREGYRDFKSAHGASEHGAEGRTGSTRARRAGNALPVAPPAPAEAERPTESWMICATTMATTNIVTRHVKRGKRRGRAVPCPYFLLSSPTRERDTNSCDDPPKLSST